MKAEDMVVNRFCIDEDVAFELSGVDYFEPWITNVCSVKPYTEEEFKKALEQEEKYIKIKGTESLLMQRTLEEI